MLEKAAVTFAEGVAYEEPLFTYPLKFYVEKIAVTDTPFYYYRYNKNGTTASYMNQPSTIVEHLIVQKLTYDFVKKQSFFDDYKKEIELYFIHSFFAEPFYFLKYRGMNLPVNLFRYMSKELVSLIPDYANNPYLEDPSLREEKQIINLIKELDEVDDVTAQEKINMLQDNLMC